MCEYLSLFWIRHGCRICGDTGSGFAEGKKSAIDQMLLTYAKQPAKLEGNSIGILNVQKRIKLLCGREYGLSYTENPAGGVTAHLLLPMNGGNVT